MFTEDARAEATPGTLTDEIRRAWLLVGRHIARHGYRLGADTGDIAATMTAFSHAQALLGDGAAAWSQSIPSVAQMEQRIAALGPPSSQGPVARLRARLGLDDADFQLLVTQATISLCPDLSRACALARSGDPEHTFLAELVGSGPDDARRLTRRLGSDATLVRRGFINTDCEVCDAVLDALCDVPRALPISVRGIVHNAQRSARPLVLSADADANIAFHGAVPLLVGPAGVGKEALLAQLWDRPVWTLELVGLLSLDTPERTLMLVCAEASVAGAALHVRVGDGLAPKAQLARIGAILRDAGVPLALSATHDDDVAAFGLVRRYRIPAPDSQIQQELWSTLLGDDALARRLAGLFRLTPGRIVQAVKDAETHTLQALSDAVRSGCSHRLGDLADPVTVVHDWDDLVVPARVRTTLDEIAMQGRLRFEVLGTWGFERRIGYGTGLACLFFGPPGTGKTMTAGLIARDLGLPMYRVDLSRIVSKYIGETEKNLRRLFAEAASARAILLFDEADGLFAKRTKVKDSKDRFANMEVAFLLQQMEAYDGISILTTNLEADLDDALRRRLRFRVYFPAPEPDERAELWRRMLPEAADVDLDDIDFDVLGESFEFSGGYIRNAALRAAFRAAGAGRAIDHDTLYDAARAEAAELGMLVRHD